MRCIEANWNRYISIYRWWNSVPEPMNRALTNASFRHHHIRNRLSRWLCVSSLHRCQYRRDNRCLRCSVGCPNRHAVRRSSVPFCCAALPYNLMTYWFRVKNALDTWWRRWRCWANCHLHVAATIPTTNCSSCVVSSTDAAYSGRLWENHCHWRLRLDLAANHLDDDSNQVLVAVAADYWNIIFVAGPLVRYGVTAPAWMINTQLE